MTINEQCELLSTLHFFRFKTQTRENLKMSHDATETSQWSSCVVGINDVLFDHDIIHGSWRLTEDE